MADLPSIGSAEEYSALLGQLEPWRGAVGEVLRRHDVAVSEPLRLGHRSTYPTALVGDQHVVKLFGPWWSGPESLEAESAAYVLLADSGLPVPELRGHGELGNGWNYLLLEQLRGGDLAAERNRLDRGALVQLARWLGQFSRTLSEIALPLDGYLSSSWRRFQDFLADRREELIDRPSDKSRLPPHLQVELETWLPQIDELVDTSRVPVLLHGDLHDHHVFGTVERSAFLPTGVIDFTDALTGDPYYEIGPLFVHTFRADRRLLASWIAGLDLPPAGALGFPKRALAFTILHEFDPLDRLREDIASLPTLDALAERLFENCAPD